MKKLNYALFLLLGEFGDALRRTPGESETGQPVPPIRNAGGLRQGQAQPPDVSLPQTGAGNPGYTP